MKKEEFFDLAERYAQGTCSEREKQLYEDFYHRMQANHEEQWQNWDLSEREQTRLRILAAVNRNINQQPAGRQRFLSTWQVAASLSLLLLAGLTTYFLWPAAVSAPEYLTKRTVPGQKSTIVLPDGSRVWLHSESSIVYPETFDGLEARNIQMTGEAFFEVQRDVTKPFVVQAGPITTTVLGTSFGVSTAPEFGSSVTVVEGKVKVDLAAASSESVILTADQQAYTAGTSALETREIDAMEATAWRQGVLRFEGETLALAAKKMARWYGVAVSVEGEAANCEVVGRYQEEDLSTILQGLKFSLGLEKITWISGEEVVLSGGSCQ